MSLPPALRVDHRCRSSVLEVETNWSLDGEALILYGEEGQVMNTIPLAMIRAMNLRFDPTRAQTNRYRCFLTLLDGKRLAFQNEHYAGFASFEDRSTSYRLLVTALARRIPTVNPMCRFITGTSAASWWTKMIGLSLMFLLLGWILFVMMAAIGSLVIVKLLLIIVLLPVLWNWAKKNRPGTFDPNAPPEDLLPGVGA